MLSLCMAYGIHTLMACLFSSTSRELHASHHNFLTRRASGSQLDVDERRESGAPVDRGPLRASRLPRRLWPCDPRGWPCWGGSDPRGWNCWDGSDFCLWGDSDPRVNPCGVSSSVGDPSSVWASGKGVELLSRSGSTGGGALGVHARLGPGGGLPVGVLAELGLGIEQGALSPRASLSSIPDWCCCWYCCWYCCCCADAITSSTW